MRNTHFQQVRDSWKTHSTFFLGKNRVMALALGRTENEEYSDKVSTFTFRYPLIR
jgi:mRNA turnover protein 4